jgi:two-component system chemotaxis response regulator CheY
VEFGGPHEGGRPSALRGSPFPRVRPGRGSETRANEEDEVQPRKILVVDDSKLIHKMFEVLLRQFSLIHAHDGLEALQCLGNHADIDLILLDINMPRMSGLEFLNQVKADSAFQTIPVVIISTEGKEEDTIRGLEAGAAAYIKKPFGNQELLEVIQRL